MSNLKAKPQPFIGVFCILLWALMKPMEGVVTRHFTSAVTVYDIMAFRCTLMYLTIWPYLSYKYLQKNRERNIFKLQLKDAAQDIPQRDNLNIYDIWPTSDLRNFCSLLGKSITGNLGCICLFEAYKFLPVGEIQCFNFSAGIVTSTLAWIFLKDKMTWVNITSMSLTVIGCIIVAQPRALLIAAGVISAKDEAEQVYADEPEKVVLGLLLCLGIFFFFGLTNFFSRAIKKGLHWSVLIQNNVLVGSCIFWPIVIYQKGSIVTFIMADFWLLCAIGFLGFFSQYLMIVALCYESPAVVTVLGSTTIVFSFVCDVLFFSQPPALSGVFGAGLIIISVLIEGYLQYRKQQALKADQP